MDGVIALHVLSLFDLELFVRNVKKVLQFLSFGSFSAVDRLLLPELDPFVGVLSRDSRRHGFL